MYRVSESPDAPTRRAPAGRRAAGRPARAAVAPHALARGPPAAPAPAPADRARRAGRADRRRRRDRLGGARRERATAARRRRRRWRRARRRPDQPRGLRRRRPRRRRRSRRPRRPRRPRPPSSRSAGSATPRRAPSTACRPTTGAPCSPHEDQLRRPDLMIANLEGTYSTPGPSKCDGQDSSVCYAFQAPPSYVTALPWAGIDMVSVANNHSYDYLQARLRPDHRGADRPPTSSTPAARRRVDRDRGERRARGGRRVLAVLVEPERQRHPGGARSSSPRPPSKADVVVVLMHAGAEGADKIHTPTGAESAFGEARGDSRAFAHAVRRRRRRPRAGLRTARDPRHRALQAPPDRLLAGQLRRLGQLRHRRQPEPVGAADREARREGAHPQRALALAATSAARACPRSTAATRPPTSCTTCPPRTSPRPTSWTRRGGSRPRWGAPRTDGGRALAERGASLQAAHRVVSSGNAVARSEAHRPAPCTRGGARR